jgi:hypothetical protein
MICPGFLALLESLITTRHRFKVPLAVPGMPRFQGIPTSSLRTVSSTVERARVPQVQIRAYLRTLEYDEGWGTENLSAGVPRRWFGESIQGNEDDA